MRNLPEGSLVFTESTKIRKRRTVVLIPSESKKHAFYMGWAECGPDDTFETKEGIKQANKRANKAKWASLRGKDLPGGCGRITAKNTASNREEYVKDLQDVLYNTGVLRTKNSVELSDMFRVVHHTRRVQRALRPLINDIAVIIDGVENNDVPMEIWDLASVATPLLKELKRWRKLNPKVETQLIKDKIVIPRLSSPAPDSSSQEQSSGQDQQSA